MKLRHPNAPGATAEAHDEGRIDLLKRSGWREVEDDSLAPEQTPELEVVPELDPENDSDQE